MGEHNSLSVSQILARVRDEDSAIIQSLLNSLGAQTHPYLITMGLEEGEIEEVIFDAMTLFIRKVQKGDYLDQGVSVMAYLSKIVRYRAYHYIRKRQPKTVPLDQANYTQAEPDNMSLDKWDIVREAIRLLNPKERQLIDLFYFSGYKDKDILDLHLMDYSSVDSIKSQRYKCIQKLIKLTGELQTKTWSMLVFGQSLTLFI